MKIIISPSKGYKLNNYISKELDTSLPKYISNADYINEELARLSREEIRDYYKIKNDNLVDTIYNLIRDYSGNDSTNNSHALNYYNGVCYKEILRSDDLDAYYNKYLKILSAKYGILSPGDIIKPYRLDFTVCKEINYFRYYKEIIYNELANEDFVINLASNEFSKLLNNKNLVTITFKQNKNGLHKKISSYCKKARGTYLSFLAINDICTRDKLTEFNLDGYSLYEENDKEIIFIKDID